MNKFTMPKSAVELDAFEMLLCGEAAALPKKSAMRVLLCFALAEVRDVARLFEATHEAMRQVTSAALDSQTMLRDEFRLPATSFATKAERATECMRDFNTAQQRLAHFIARINSTEEA